MSSIFDIIQDEFPKKEMSKKPLISKQESSIFDIAETLPDNPPEESLLKSGLRHGIRTASRIGETVLGTAGDILKLPKKLIPLSEDLEGGRLSDIIPGSEELKKSSEKLLGEKVKPRTSSEKRSDEFIEDITSLFLPIKGKLPFLKSLQRSTSIALGGQAAKETAKRFKVGEEGQEAAKITGIIVSSLIDPKSAVKHVNGLYDLARSNRPVNAVVKAGNLRNASNALETSLKKGGTAPSKTKTLEKLKEIKGKIKNNNIEVDELESFKRTLNELRSALYEEFKSDKIGRKSAKRNLDNVSKVIDDALTEYGKANPSWEKYYRPANEAFGAIEQSKKISNFIKKHANVAAPTSGGALILESIFGGGLPVKTAAIGGIGTVALKGAELMARIMKSKTLRNHYLNVLGAAAKEDATALSRNLQKLIDDSEKEGILSE